MRGFSIWRSGALPLVMQSCKPLQKQHMKPTAAKNRQSTTAVCVLLPSTLFCCPMQIFSKSVTAAAVAVTGEPDEFEKIALKVWDFDRALARTSLFCQHVVHRLPLGSIPG